MSWWRIRVCGVMGARVYSCGHGKLPGRGNNLSRDKWWEWDSRGKIRESKFHSKGTACQRGPWGRKEAMKPSVLTRLPKETVSDRYTHKDTHTQIGTHTQIDTHTHNCIYIIHSKELAHIIMEVKVPRRAIGKLETQESQILTSSRNTSQSHPK